MFPIQRQAEQFDLPAATQPDMSPASESAQEDAGANVMAAMSRPMWSGPGDGSAAAHVG